MNLVLTALREPLRVALKADLRPSAATGNGPLGTEHCTGQSIRRDSAAHVACLTGKSSGMLTGAVLIQSNDCCNSDSEKQDSSAGAKAHTQLVAIAARLKSCPDAGLEVSTIPKRGPSISTSA